MKPVADLVPIVVTLLAFATIAGVVFVFGQNYSAHAHMQRRLPRSLHSLGGGVRQPDPSILGFVAKLLPDTRFGVSDAFRERLRRELQKAGYFGPDAVDICIVGRAVCLIAVAAIAYVFSLFFPTDTHPFFQVAAILIAVIVAVAGPDAYLARRRRKLVRQFRLTFPDMLDLLVVCVDAGLTLETAFDRVRSEIAKRSHALGMNLELMGAEMRAGRTMIEALNSLAGRLELDEAGSFASMLRQSIELGSDLGNALRVFSDEMRDKRLLRAEEAANKLTVKMVLPLGLFIFPVVLLVVMLPVMIKLLSVLK